MAPFVLLVRDLKEPARFANGTAAYSAQVGLAEGA